MFLATFTPGPMQRRIVAIPLLSAASLLVALALGDLVARRRGAFLPHPQYAVGEEPDRSKSSFVVDSNTGWRMRSHFAFHGELPSPAEYRSNGQGFRADADFDTAGSRPVIAFLGD